MCRSSISPGQTVWPVIDKGIGAWRSSIQFFHSPAGPPRHRPHWARPSRSEAASFAPAGGVAGTVSLWSDTVVLAALPERCCFPLQPQSRRGAEQLRRLIPTSQARQYISSDSGPNSVATSLLLPRHKHIYGLRGHMLSCIMHGVLLDSVPSLRYHRRIERRAISPKTGWRRRDRSPRLPGADDRDLGP
jgi:hypothetical protein